MMQPRRERLLKAMGVTPWRLRAAGAVSVAEVEAANEDEMVERAKAITRGTDPVLLRRPGQTS